MQFYQKHIPFSTIIFSHENQTRIMKSKWQNGKNFLPTAFICLFQVKDFKTGARLGPGQSGLLCFKHKLAMKVKVLTIDPINHKLTLLPALSYNIEMMQNNVSKLKFYDIT